MTIDTGATVDEITDNIVVEWISPDKAREYLGQNTHNRNLRSRVVRAYAEDIRNGDWQANGESIKFGVDGVLQDGQHRLAAIIEADTPLRVIVVRNLPAAAQDTIDTGAVRSFGDVLKLRGEDNYVKLAAMVRAVNNYERGSGGLGDTGVKSTNAQLLRTLEKYPWLRDGAVTVAAVQSKVSLPAQAGGLCWFLFTQIDYDDCEHFFTRLSSPEDQHKGDPIYALRAALLNSTDKGVRGTRNVRYLTALTIKAWNKFRDGEPLLVLNFRPGGAKPERFPEPH